MTKSNVFISYSRSDPEVSQQVRALKVVLQARGIATWDITSEATLGQDLPEMLEAAMRSSDAVVALVSATDVDRPWLYWELGASVGLGKKLLIVVLDGLDPVSLPAPARAKKLVRWDNPEGVANQIAMALAA